MTIIRRILDKVDTRGAVIALLCVTIAVYANSLTNSFVWDDYSVIVENDFVKSWGNFPRLFDRSYLTRSSDLDDLGQRDIGSGEFSYRPVVTLSYFIDYSLWKLDAFGYHLINVILHTFNTLLLFILMRLIAGERKIALLTALFFALHPVNTEVVNVISFREDLFAFLFFVSAFIFHIKSREDMSGRAATLYAVSLGMFLLALFSKESAMIFPLALLWYDYILKKIPGDIFAHVKKYYLGYIGVLLLYCFVRFYLFSSADTPIVTYPMQHFFTRVFTMAKVFVVYLFWFLVPVSIHPTSPDDPRLIAYSFFEPPVFFSLLAILVFLITAIKMRRRMPYLSYGMFWFLTTLIPVSNIVFPLGNYMAARYLYVPIAGLCLLVAVFLVRLPHVRGIQVTPVIFKKASRDAILLLVLCYSLFTFVRNMNWRNEVVFRSGMVEKYPENAKAHSAFAAALRKEGFLDRAIAEYTIALTLDPDYAEDYNALGVCYYEKGMYAEAIDQLKKALALTPNLVSAYVNLGNVLGDKGLYQEAKRYFEKAIQLDGKFLAAYNGLGITYARIQHYDQAKKMWEKVLEIDPNNREARRNLEKLKQVAH